MKALLIGHILIPIAIILVLYVYMGQVRRSHCFSDGQCFTAWGEYIIKDRYYLPWAPNEYATLSASMCEFVGGGCTPVLVCHTSGHICAFQLEYDSVQQQEPHTFCPLNEKSVNTECYVVSKSGFARNIEGGENLYNDRIFQGFGPILLYVFGIILSLWALIAFVILVAYSLFRRIKRITP
ncbi:MAG: hypothetical protein LBE89_02430 [Helicobacteraceae bacterium]|nr:hypothetical protein [Helicobacteraceae bacterium]